MKKLLSPIIFPMLFIAITFNSCNMGADSKEAEGFAEKFYSYLSEKDYDKAMEMIDEESFAASSEEEWLTVLTQKEQLGKFEGYKKDIGFNTHYNNGVTTVELNYTCTYEKITIYEKLTMVKRGSEYKIKSYEYNEDKSKIS